MFQNLYEDITLATMADYDRLVNRLLLESEARSANDEQREKERKPVHRHFPWVPGRHHTTPAH